MSERQNPGAEKEVPVVVRSGEAKFCEGIEAAADGGARETGGGADLRERQVVASLRERLNNGEATGERSHEIRITGEGVAIARVLGRCGGDVRLRRFPRIEFRQGKRSGDAEIPRIHELADRRTLFR